MTVSVRPHRPATLPWALNRVNTASFASIDGILTYRVLLVPRIEKGALGSTSLAGAAMMPVVPGIPTPTAELPFVKFPEVALTTTWPGVVPARRRAVATPASAFTVTLVALATLAALLIGALAVDLVATLAVVVVLALAFVLVSGLASDYVTITRGANKNYVPWAG